ncbi:MAG: hypothetical protein AAB403_13100 [Planctomycetota bacterium]
MTLHHSPYVNGYPKYCGFCSANLAHCRNVWRDRELRADYCSRTCLEGARLTRAAGMIHSPWYVGLATILAVFMLAFTFTGGTRAWAQDVDGTVHQQHSGHAANHNIYKGWTQSNGWSSCCNGDDPENGVKGDCRPAKAYPDEHGQWHVLIRGKYRPVPSGAIRDFPTPDGNSHVCEDETYGIMCFVRGLPKS